jgi:hypothetical protein
MSIAVAQGAPAGNRLKSTRRSIRAHVIAGLVVVAIVAGGFGGWASTVEISGALIAPGQIVVESNVKKVQHPTGGVVGELLARDGDVVKPSSPRISTRRWPAPRGSRPSSAGCSRCGFRRSSPTAPPIPLLPT